MDANCLYQITLNIYYVTNWLKKIEKHQNISVHLYIVSIQWKAKIPRCRNSSKFNRKQKKYYTVGMVWFIVFNATFNNISVISWRSVLLVEETGEPREINRLVGSHWPTLSHNFVHLALIEILTHDLCGHMHWMHKQL